MKSICLALLFAFALCAGMRTDVEFARVDGVSLTLDAWTPEGRGPFAAVIVVHGGGFTQGDKQTYVKPLFDPLTKGGFAWFTINYRLAPKYKITDAADDVERAVAWVRAHATEYRVDPKRIALMGESAGGHLVSLAGARNRRASRVRAVVSFYGPHDMATLSEQRKTPPDRLEALFGVSDLSPASLAVIRKVSPINCVTKDMPPYLLIHGTADTTVPYSESVKMCQAMKKAGARCELYTVEGAGHGVGGWEKNPAFQSYKTKMIEWLRSELR